MPDCGGGAGGSSRREKQFDRYDEAIAALKKLADGRHKGEKVRKREGEKPPV